MFGFGMALSMGQRARLTWGCPEDHAGRPGNRKAYKGSYLSFRLDPRKGLKGFKDQRAENTIIPPGPEKGIESYIMQSLPNLWEPNLDPRKGLKG